MTNPFDAPRSDAAPTPARGALDLGLALSDGWDAMTRNFVPWLGLLLSVFALTLLVVGSLAGPGVALMIADDFSVASFAALGLGMLLLVPAAIVLFPPLTWGSTRFTLDALDGQASLGTVYEPLSRLGETLPGTLGVLFLTFLVNLVGSVGSQIVQMVAMVPGLALGPDSLAGMGIQIVGMMTGLVVSLVWALAVGARFGFALYYLVEDGLSPMDAMTTSWRATSELKAPVALLQVLVGLVMFGGFLVCIVGSVPAVMVATAMQGSAFRQVKGMRGR